MKMSEYLRDRILLLTMHVGCMLLLAGFLLATGDEAQYCLLIIILKSYYKPVKNANDPVFDHLSDVFVVGVAV